MKNYPKKIESLKSELKDVQMKFKLSLDSVIKERSDWSYIPFENTCKQVLHILEGEIYKSYQSDYKYTIRRGEVWKSDIKHDFCRIYGRSGYGEAIGLISTKKDIYKSLHNSLIEKMWKERVYNSYSENRSLLAFNKELERNPTFLIACLCSYYKIEYETYENKKLNIPKFYVFMFENDVYNDNDY